MSLLPCRADLDYWNWPHTGAGGSMLENLAGCQEVMLILHKSTGMVITSIPLL
jgi:hypothetical protein